METQSPLRKAFEQPTGVPGKNYCWHLTDGRTDVELKCTAGCTNVRINQDIVKLKRKLCSWLNASRAADQGARARTQVKYSGMMPVRIGQLRDGPSPIIMFAEKPARPLLAADADADADPLRTRPRTNSLHEQDPTATPTSTPTPELQHSSPQKTDEPCPDGPRLGKAVADKAVSTDPVRRRRNRTKLAPSGGHRDDGTHGANRKTSVSVSVSAATIPGGNTRCCASDMQRFVESLNQLKRCGWYWGPLTSEQAERVLDGMADGSFLMRDSSHESYILSLSFRAGGATYHARVEHHGGKFRFSSMCAVNQQDGTKSADCATASSSIMELIELAIDSSRQGKYQYFMRSTRSNEQQAVAVMLLRAVSRFEPRHNAFPSLMHLCRFEILKHVRCDHIDLLPLPQALRMYLKEKQFYIENPNITQPKNSNANANTNASDNASASASASASAAAPCSKRIPATSHSQRTAKSDQLTDQHAKETMQMQAQTQSQVQAQAQTQTTAAL